MNNTDYCSGENLQTVCAQAEKNATVGGHRSALADLTAIAKTHPHSPDPKISLAKVHFQIALQDAPRSIDRPSLLSARKELLSALILEKPPALATLTLLQEVTHELAMHEEQSTFFGSLGRRDKRPEVCFRALCWAATALQCWGQELLAAGRKIDAARIFDDSVQRHREALSVWPNAPASELLSSYCAHILSAYCNAGKSEQWLEDVECLVLDRHDEISPTDKVTILVEASDVAARGRLFEEAIRLAHMAWQEFDRTSTRGDMYLRISALGSLLQGYHGMRDQGNQEETALQITQLLEEMETDPSEEAQLKVYYNVATRYFVVTGEWERAIETSTRAIELWDMGAHHWYLAQALWAQYKDRNGTLHALRNAARDTQWAGHFQCRNLADEFKEDPVFSDVHNDPEFLQAIQVEVIQS